MSAAFALFRWFRCWAPACLDNVVPSAALRVPTPTGAYSLYLVYASLSYSFSTEVTEPLSGLCQLKLF